MKLSNISIQNIFGVRDISVDLNTAITLFCGPNGAGKSSIQNAVRLALTGTPSRVSLKKDYGQMIRDGAKKASVAVTLDGQCYGLDLPKGATVHAEQPFLPLVLEPSSLATMSAQERRKALFDLMGVKVGADTVRARLERRQCNMTLAEQVIPMLRTGFPPSHDHAKNKASELRGEWKAITGEVYGTQKAEGWKPEAVTFDANALTEVRDKIGKVNAYIEEAQTKTGELMALEKQYQYHQANAAALKAKAVDQERHKAALEAAEIQLAKQRAQVEKLEAQAAAATTTPANPLACPHCSGTVELQDGQLVPCEPQNAPDTTLDHAAIANLDKHRSALEMLVRARDNRQAEYEVAKLAQAQLDALTATAPNVEQGAVEKAKGETAALKAAHEELQEEARQLEEQERQAKSAATKETRASQIHQQITDWLKIAEAFAPDGIPGELLDEAIGPVNTRLGRHAFETGWMQARITPEIEIEADGRAYHLLSESERWRTDAMLAECVGFFAGLKLLCLDRFDVLSLPNRSTLINWLAGLTDDAAPELDTILLFGTLKSCPNSNDLITAHWIENGAITENKQENAA